MARTPVSNEGAAKGAAKGGQTSASAGGAGREAKSASGPTQAGAAAAGTSEAARPSNPTPSWVIPQACWEFAFNNPERSSAERGIAVHRAIRENLSLRFAQRYGSHVSIRLPDASFNHYRDRNGLAIGGKYHGQGDVDLAFKAPTEKSMLLGEIKPANESFLEGEDQLKNYIDKANANEKLKQKFGVKVFSPMLPERFPLPPSIISSKRVYEVRWCLLGSFLYKQILVTGRRKEKRKEGGKTKDKEEERPYKEQVIEQRKEAVSGRKTLEVFPNIPRPLEAWTPVRLRRDIDAGSLVDGLYRDRYSAKWPSGHSTNVVVWVRGLEVQYYQEFPTSPEFWAGFAERRGLSEREADLIRRTLSDYNRDLWSFIVDGRSPSFAKEELRTIYNERLRAVFLEVPSFVTAGVASSASNALRGASGALRSQRATARTPIARGPGQTLPAEEPLPDYIYRSVEVADDLLKAVERSMRVGP